MPWFTRFCRQAGLLVHNVVKPVERKHKQQVRKQVEEEKVGSTVTLRRTTVEEVEIRQPDQSDQHKA